MRRSFDDDGPGSNDPVDTLWVYDGWQQALEFVNTNTSSDAGPGDLAHVYFWATPLTDYLLADEIKDGSQTSDDVRWAFLDHLGTPRLVVAHLGGWDYAFNERTYDTFGNLLSESDPTYGTAIGFTGKMFDITTGFGYHINRWYDAAVGRWISEDPIVFAGGDTNLARWVGNQVTGYTDPTGLLESPTAHAILMDFATDSRDPAMQQTAQSMLDSTVDGYEVAQDFVSHTSSMLPGVGTVMSMFEAATGRDIHGRQLSALEREMAIQDARAALIPGMGSLMKMGRRSARQASDLARAARSARRHLNLTSKPMSGPIVMYNRPPSPPALPKPVCPQPSQPVRHAATSTPPQVPLLSAPSGTRLPQDVAVNSTPPVALPWQGRRIGSNSRQHAALQRDIQTALAQGARDIRVNQQQVNAAQQRVGINQPDLQYTRPDGTRVYVEYDSPTLETFPNTPRGPQHADRIIANDPSGIVILRVIP